MSTNATQSEWVKPYVRSLSESVKEELKRLEYLGKRDSIITQQSCEGANAQELDRLLLMLDISIKSVKSSEQDYFFIIDSIGLPRKNQVIAYVGYSIFKMMPKKSHIRIYSGQDEYGSNIEIEKAYPTGITIRTDEAYRRDKIDGLEAAIRYFGKPLKELKSMLKEVESEQNLITTIKNPGDLVKEEQP